MKMSNSYFNTDNGLLSLHPGGISLTLSAASNARLAAGDKVLDIGCGTGTSLLALAAEYDIEPYGTDISEDVLSLASSINTGFEFRQCSAYTLPYPESYFDAAMLECVLTLFERPYDALREALRILRPGGRLIISSLTAIHSNTMFCQDPTGCSIIKDGLLYRDTLVNFMQEHDCVLMHEEDCRSDLTQYVVDSIMEYGSIEARIASEIEYTGASVFDCNAIPDPAKATYELFIFLKN